MVNVYRVDDAVWFGGLVGKARRRGVSRVARGTRRRGITRATVLGILSLSSAFSRTAPICRYRHLVTMGVNGATMLTRRVCSDVINVV
jgi:hypothetical protein